MLFGDYKFFCRFTEPATLPAYKGSTFRGVFGHALKSVVCALKRRECDACLLSTKCIYALVFETRLAVPLPADARISAAPHPFVIRPPPTPETQFSPGDAFDFSLLLFGEVNRHLPYFIYAFHRMGKIGVGKRINGRRGRFILETVVHDEQIIYSDDDQILRINDRIPHLALADPPETTDKITRLSISLKTPLRLKFKNRFTDNLPFHILARAMLRRVSTLMSCYDGGEPPLDYQGIIRKAGAVDVIRSDLRWYNWERYSNRQRQKMPMGGMLGSVTYKGALGEFMPLTAFCEKVHIGKQTAFGLGEIAVTERLNGCPE